MDVNFLTLAVISLAGFGKRVEWVDSTENENIPQGYRVSFLRAIDTTTTNMVPILLFPGWLMNLIPHLRPVRLAHTQLEDYIRELIRSERTNLERDADYQNQKARSNLLTSVVRVSRTEAQMDEKASGQARKDMFTERETMGNLFIYLLAGYETTANAIVYSLVLLALHQDIESKVIAEIDTVVAAATAQGRSELSHKDDFEKLVYTCVHGKLSKYAMRRPVFSNLAEYESFRLYPGVTLITKMTAKGDQIYVSSNGPSSPPTPFTLPPETRVYLNAPGTHYNPRYWPDPEKLDPSRWMSADASGGVKMNSVKEPAGKKVVGADKTRQMRGRLLTFSDGSRACLGRKFAQAEFMAFVATLLRDYRVVLAEGEDPESVYHDLFLKSAGKVTMSPCRQFGLNLKKRGEAQ